MLCTRKRESPATAENEQQKTGSRKRDSVGQRSFCRLEKNGTRHRPVVRRGIFPKNARFPCRNSWASPGTLVPSDFSLARLCIDSVPRPCRLAHCANGPWLARCETVVGRGSGTVKRILDGLRLPRLRWRFSSVSRGDPAIADEHLHRARCRLRRVLREFLSRQHSFLSSAADAM